MNTGELAERVGFEPTVRYNRTPDFESGAFDHSATFPGVGLLRKPPHFAAALQTKRRLDRRASFTLGRA